MSEGFLDKDYRLVIDGEPVVFKQGTSIEEAREEYKRRTGGFFSGLEAGFERLVGSLGAIPDVLAGDLLGDQEALDQAGREYAEANRLTSEALPIGTTYQDVIKAYQEDGLSEAIPEALRFSAESIGQTIPYTLPSMFAGKVASTEAGLGVASALARSIPYLRTASVAMPPSVLKFGLGAAAGIGTLALQFFGDNMQRQYETAQAENPEAQVTPDQLNSFSAALAAAPQAGMDYIVIALTSGLGRGPQIAAARSLQDSLSAVGATAKASAFPTLAQTARASFAESALEFPTELVQTILERAQAGLPVSMDDAEFVQEMIATAAGTLPVAGAFGSYGTARSYLANKRAYENFEAMSEQEQKVRNEYEGRREQSLQAAYDRSIENYEKNVNEYNSKIEDARNESFENAALIESEVQRAKNSAPMQVKDVLDVAKNRNIKTDDDAFKSFVYRSTGGKTNDINEASQDELRAMRTILTGFGIQNYFDPKEEGVSLPQFTSDEIESVATGFRSGAKLTNETVRKKLHERFFSKAKDVEGPVDFTDSESSNNIASSIIEEMKLRGYAVEDDKGVVKARKPKYTESQYRSLMDLAQEKGSINRGDYERITNRFNEADFDSFINDAKNRGDMPSQQRGMPEGEYAPLVFRATMEEKFTGEGDSFLTPIVDDTGRPVIKADAVRAKKIRSRLTAGNVVTEVVKADGYFVRDENGEIVGGSTTKKGANEEAKFLNKNKGKYRVVDQNTGNPFIGTKSEVEAEIKRSKGKGVGLPDYSGQKIENIAGKFTVSKDRQSGYAIRQFVSPFRNVKDPRTGEIKREAPGDFAQKSTITEVSFSPDMDIANDIRDQFAQYAMPGLADWDVSQRNLGKSKRDQLQKLFASEGKRFVPPSPAEAVPEGPPARPEKFNRISKREKVLNSIYPENAEKGREVLRVVESKLKEANLDKAVIGAVMNKIERSGSDGEVEIAEGSYSPNDDGFRRIAISLDQIKDANTKEEIRIAVASIMDHEMIHAMRDLDLFTMQEWSVLSNSTYRVRNRDGVTFFDDAVNRYGGQDVEYILEEAVAEMYRQYYSVPEVRRQIAGQPRTLIERIAIFMEKMYNALNGAGFVTAADAISGMKTIQSREAGEVRTIQGDRNPLRTATPVETEEDKDATEEAVRKFNEERLAIAYHGSHADFKKFDSEYINTGEGAQAFGWGLYFTSLRGIAEFYRSRITPVAVSYKGKTYIDFGPRLTKKKWQESIEAGRRDIAEGYIRALVARDISLKIEENIILGKFATVPEVIKSVRDDILNKQDDLFRLAQTQEDRAQSAESRNFGRRDIARIAERFRSRAEAARSEAEEQANFVQALVEEIDSISEGDVVEQGQVYEVDIPEISDLINWDAPIKIQQDGVRQAFSEFINNENLDKKYIDSNLSFGDIYSDLASDLGSERKVSEALNSVGIKGHRYGAGQLSVIPSDGVNYVIYDDKAISIVRKIYEYIPPVDEFDIIDFNELAELSDDRLAKLLDDAEPYSYELVRATPGELGELIATVRVPADTPEQEEVAIKYKAVGRNNDYYITFTDAATGSYSRTGKLGNRALRLLKTVLNLTELLITDLDAVGFEFSAASEPRYKNGVLVNNKSRQKLYARGVKQLGEKHGFKIKEDRSDESSYFTGSKTDDGSYEYILNDNTKPSDPSPAPDPSVDPDSETIQQWASGLREVADELRPPTDPSITDELNIVEPLITEDRSLSLPDTLFFGYPTYGSVVETNRFTTGPDGSLTTRQLLNSNPSYVNETVSSIFNDRSFAELNELIASASTIRDRLLIRSELRDLALENPLPGNVNRPYLLNIHTTNIPQAVVGDTFTEQNRAFELLPLAMLDDIQSHSRSIDSILTDLDSSMRVPREQKTMVANPIIEGMSSSEVSSLRERMRSSGIFSPYSRTAPARSDTVTQLTQQEIDLGYLRIALVDHAVSPDAISRRVTSRIEQDIRSSVRGSSYYSHYLSLENMIDTLADAGLNISRGGKTRILFAANNLYDSNQNAVNYIDAVTKHGPSEVLSRLTARLENAESERASLSRQPEEALGNLSEDRLSRIIKRQAAYDADVTTDSAGKFAAKFEVPAEREERTGDYMPSVEFFFNAVGPSDGNGNWNISFNDDSGRFDRTGRLGALRAARVFKTVYDLTDTFLKGKSPDSFTFTAAVEVTPSGQLKRTRQSLYSSMLKDLAYENGYEISETKTNGDSFFSAKKGDYKYNLIDQSKPLTQLPFDPADPLGVSEDNQAANEAIRRRREADQELQESLEQAVEEEGVRNAESERFSSTPNLGVASAQYSIPQINELSEESSNPLTMRSVGIAKGLIEPERLSKNNDRRVRKVEPDTRDRDFEALTGMFPARNEKTFWETVKEVIWNPNSEERKKFLIRIRAKFFDRYTYLGNVSKKAALLKKDDRDIRASTNAASLALLSDRANSLVSAAINNGALILRGGIARVDPTKKSLREALDPLFKSNDDLYRHWGMWMVANRSQRIIKNGQLTIVSEREINTINNNIEKRGLLPMFEQVKNDYEQWNDSVVNFMKDSGIINDELAVVFKKYADYIPFYRNMDLDGEGVEGVSPDTFKSILEAEGIDLSLGANQRLKSLFPTLTDQRPPKRLTGGDQQMVDPLTGIMQNLRAAVVAGTKNVAAQRVMRDAIDAEMATEVFADSQGRVDPNAFTVRVEGKEKYFTTDDDLLIDTLIGFNQGKVNVHPFFRVPATILRESVARSPLFIFRNLFRDSIAVWTTSGANMTPVIDTMKKFTNDLRGETEEGTYSILENAGIVGGYDYVFEPKKFERDFRNRMRKQGMTLKKGSSDHVLNMFNKLWDSMGRVSQKSDAATRQVIYEDTLQNLLSKGVDRAEAESEAIFQAMETLNFSRRGNSAIIGAAMGAIPFFNARIQGLDVMYRSLRGQYKSNRDGELKAMNTFLARGAQIAAMTMAYTMLSADDEEYLSASEGERDQNWIINGVKLPIPFEIGFIWKTLPERMTRVMMGDDTYQDAYKSFVDGMISAFQLPITGPQAFAPMVEVLSNYSFFTGRPVVPLYMEGRPRSEQYQYYTSEFAKALGSLTGTSPLQIEHLIGGYTGTLGSYALGVLDGAVSMAKGKPIMMDWRSDEIPVIGSLFQSAGASDGQMQRWNEFYFSVRGVKAALNAARSDPERQRDLLERYGSVLAVKPQIEKINSRLNELRNQRKTVYLSRNLTDSQKRQMLDSLDKAIKQTISTGERLREYRPFSFTDI